MKNEIVDRIQTIAAELLTDEQVEVAANGEDYYTISGTSRDGRKSSFAPIWLPPSASDQHMREKLRREFAMSLNPDSADIDDLSVPNLQNAGRQQHQ